jgi:hypothetical protein
MANKDIDVLRNTASMSMAPEYPSDYDELDEVSAGRGLTLNPCFTGKMFQEAVNFPIIAENWEHIKYGRVKRAWEKEFTQAERNKISRYRGKFHRWYLVTGVPKRVMVNLNTLTLLQRAVNFFASN